MKFFNKILLVGMFIVSGVSLNAFDNSKFKSLTKEEYKQNIESEIQKVLQELDPSILEQLSKESLYVLASLIGGFSCGCALDAYSQGKMQFEEPLAHAFSFGLGISIAVWSYVLLKVIDRKLINSNSDLEKKIQLLEKLLLIVEKMDKK